jgi:hypothetical protein
MDPPLLVVVAAVLALLAWRAVRQVMAAQDLKAL